MLIRSFRYFVRSFLNFYIVFLLFNQNDPSFAPLRVTVTEDAFLWATEKEHWDIIKMLIIESTYVSDFIKNYQANLYTKFSNKHVLKAMINQAEEEKKLNTQTR